MVYYIRHQTMNEFLQMNIFFLVTTIIVVAIGVLLALVLVRILKILGHFEHISGQFSAESELVRQDIAELRSNIREEGFKVKHFAQFSRSTLGRFMRAKRRREE